jgi:hypothetical protein
MNAKEANAHGSGSKVLRAAKAAATLIVQFSEMVGFPVNIAMVTGSRASKPAVTLKVHRLGMGSLRQRLN